MTDGAECFTAMAGRLAAGLRERGVAEQKTATDAAAEQARRAVGALRRAADEERETYALDAFRVGYERGFMAGYEAAERGEESVDEHPS